MGKLGIADLKDGNHAAEGGGCEIQVHGVLRRLARGGCSHAASGNFRGVRLRKLSQGNNGSD